MQPYEEVEESVEVPRNTGVAGFLRAIEAILRKPRLQRVTIDGRGKVAYRYFVREGEPRETIAMDFASLEPLSVLKAGVVTELPFVEDRTAIQAVSQLFRAVTVAQLFPLAFVMSTDSLLWPWYERATGVEWPTRNSFYGLPVHFDHNIERATLFLCAGYAREGALVDTQESFKLLIPETP